MIDSAGGAAVKRDSSSYPGGKSGAGIYQRLINLIPPHDVLIVPFAGHCGVVRNIRPASHTIVIDKSPRVCEWWDKWRRSKRGRAIEIHNCDGIEWLRYSLGVTEYLAAEKSGAGLRREIDRRSSDRTFVFCDPPYVIEERSSGDRIYDFELENSDHQRFLSVVTSLDATRYQILICGFASQLYSALDPAWNAIAHRVPTRRGLQDEKIWMNYEMPKNLHDWRYLGENRRERERIRRRQNNWVSQLLSMPTIERQAMIETLGSYADNFGGR